MNVREPAGSILFDAVEAVRADTIEFDAWHGNDHLPALRRQLPQALERRYVSASRACMTSIFELGAEAAAQVAEPPVTPTDLTRRHEQFVAHPLSTHQGPQAGQWLEARIAYPVFFAVPENEAEEFNAWYEQEHLRMLFGCSSWLACRRFRIAEHPHGWTHLALHYLADASALRSPERTAARSTAWRDRLAERPWFKGDYRVLHRLA